MAAVHLSVAFHLLCATCLLEVSQSVIFLKIRLWLLKGTTFNVKMNVLHFQFGKLQVSIWNMQNTISNQCDYYYCVVIVIVIN